MKVSAMPSDHQVDAPEEGIADTFNHAERVMRGRPAAWIIQPM
jgi:hypothetical protein